MEGVKTILYLKEIFVQLLKIKKMRVKVKKLNEKAVIPFKNNQSDFGYDVTATSVEEIAPNIYKYGTGLAFQIDREDLESEILLDIDGRPRSSIWKTGMVLANSTATLDEDYTGEVQLVFYHVIPNMPKYEVGDRIGQIKLGFSQQLEFEEVDELEKTVRGEGGFGSTGK